MHNVKKLPPRKTKPVAHQAVT